MRSDNYLASGFIETIDISQRNSDHELRSARMHNKLIVPSITLSVQSTVRPKAMLLIIK